MVIVLRMRSRSSTIFFYCPTFQNASWSALVAKLWQQLTIFFASLSPFCFFTLVHAIFKRHPMEPGIKAEVKKVVKKKSRSVFAAICDDQIRHDRCRKSPGVSPA